MDCGDYVVVTNARKIRVTGKKAEQKLYRHHTMYPGGLKEIQYKDMMQRKPDEVCYWLYLHSDRALTLFYRSSGKRFQACYPRISFEIDGWIGCGYLKGRIWVSSSIIYSKSMKEWVRWQRLRERHLVHRLHDDESSDDWHQDGMRVKDALTGCKRFVYSRTWFI